MTTHIDTSSPGSKPEADQAGACLAWLTPCCSAPRPPCLQFNDSEHTEKWEFYWVTDAFWQVCPLAPAGGQPPGKPHPLPPLTARVSVQVLSFGVLLVICILWRPSHNSQCYAYTEADGARSHPAPAVAASKRAAR